MDFEKFKKEVCSLNKNQKNKIREKYIEKFIDTGSIIYQEQIKTMHKYIDGYCYKGYLWDCIICASIVDEQFIDQYIKKNDQVYIFWDIHTCERILKKNYWKFEKDTVLQGSMKFLLDNEEFLPEDIYIVDRDFTWTLIKTHEDVDGKRYCLKSGNI